MIRSRTLKKLFSAVTVLTLTAVILTGCGGSGASGASGASSQAAAPSKSLDEMYDAVLAKNPISNQFEIADLNLKLDYQLDTADVAAYKGVKSNDNGDAGLVLVIETIDGKTDAVKDALSQYQQDQIAFYGNYAEFADAQANVKDAALAQSGNYVILAFASSEAESTDAVASAVTDALS